MSHLCAFSYCPQGSHSKNTERSASEHVLQVALHSTAQRLTETHKLPP